MELIQELSYLSMRKFLLTKVMKGVKGVRVGMKVVVEEANDYIG